MRIIYLYDSVITEILWGILTTVEDASTQYIQLK